MPPKRGIHQRKAKRNQELNKAPYTRTSTIGGKELGRRRKKQQKNSAGKPKPQKAEPLSPEIEIDDDAVGDAAMLTSSHLSLPELQIPWPLQFFGCHQAPEAAPATGDAQFSQSCAACAGYHNQTSCPFFPHITYDQIATMRRMQNRPTPLSSLPPISTTYDAGNEFVLLLGQQTPILKVQIMDRVALQLGDKARSLPACLIIFLTYQMGDLLQQIVELHQLIKGLKRDQVKPLRESFVAHKISDAWYYMRDQKSKSTSNQKCTGSPSEDVAARQQSTSTIVVPETASNFAWYPFWRQMDNIHVFLENDVKHKLAKLIQDFNELHIFFRGNFPPDLCTAQWLLYIQACCVHLATEVNTLHDYLSNWFYIATANRQSIFILHSMWGNQNMMRLLSARLMALVDERWNGRRLALKGAAQVPSLQEFNLQSPATIDPGAVGSKLVVPADGKAHAALLLMKTKAREQIAKARRKSDELAKLAELGAAQREAKGKRKYCEEEEHGIAPPSPVSSEDYIITANGRSGRGSKRMKPDAALSLPTSSGPDFGEENDAVMLEVPCEIAQSEDIAMEDAWEDPTEVEMQDVEVEPQADVPMTHAPNVTPERDLEDSLAESPLDVVPVPVLHTTELPACFVATTSGHVMPRTSSAAGLVIETPTATTATDDAVVKTNLSSPPAEPAVTTQCPTPTSSGGARKRKFSELAETEQEEVAEPGEGEQEEERVTKKPRLFAPAKKRMSPARRSAFLRVSRARPMQDPFSHIWTITWPWQQDVPSPPLAREDSNAMSRTMLLNASFSTAIQDPATSAWTAIASSSHDRPSTRLPESSENATHTCILLDARSSTAMQDPGSGAWTMEKLL